jgi:hypothetical protein
MLVHTLIILQQVLLPLLLLLLLCHPVGWHVPTPLC